MHFIAISALELWCWRGLLRGPWTARSNQSILKEISPGCSLEGMMLKLKLQYFGHLMWRVDSLEKTLMLGAIFKCSCIWFSAYYGAETGFLVNRCVRPSQPHKLVPSLPLCATSVSLYKRRITTKLISE